MGWRDRIGEPILAGGSLAMTGCPGCCNANPDPCCSSPKSVYCADSRACADAGLRWQPEYAPDGAYSSMCVDPNPDLAVPDLATRDARDASEPSDGSSSD